MEPLSEADVIDGQTSRLLAPSHVTAFRHTERDAMRIEFDTTDAMAAEITRMMRVMECPDAEVFRRAFTLLRIHVNAALAGESVFLESDKFVGGKRRVELPFAVKTEAH